MAEPTKIKARLVARKENTSSLYENVRRSKPMFATNEEAAQAAAIQLEKLAATNNLSVEDLIREAHTTKSSHPHHIEALQLERQLYNLRSTDTP